MAFFFIQLADPQFGLFAASSGLSEDRIEGFRQMGLEVRPAPKITGFAAETRLYEKAIAEANRLRPDFVVVCGDMVHHQDDQEELAEVQRVSAGLAPDIPIYFAAGNHDAGNTPTPESLRLYRERYGADNYSFDNRGVHFVVLNSCIPFDPSAVMPEWERQVDFLKADLGRVRAGKGGRRIVVFTHHPLFVGNSDDEDSWLVIPGEQRRVLLDLLRAHDVSAVFAGHWHKNNYASDGSMQMVASGPVGYPLGDDPSGLRVIKVYEDGIQHEYFGLDDVPQTIDLDRD